MPSKIILSVVAVLALVGGAGYVLIKDRPTGETNSKSAVPAITSDSVVSKPVDAAPDPAQAITQAPKSAPSTSNPKTFTMTQVATHASVSDCWSVVGGDVYDLTSWISRHPGGPEAIVAMCGKDGTDLYNGQHGGAKKPKAMLILLKIGSLVK